MPLQSTLELASAPLRFLGSAYTSFASTLLSSVTRLLSSVPFIGEQLAKHADIPTYGLLFLFSNAMVVWPMHFALRYMDNHPEGPWFKYKINGARRPPAALEAKAGISGAEGRLLVGPVQEAVVYGLVYNTLLKPEMTGVADFGGWARRYAGAVLFTDIVLYWYHRAVHTYPVLWKNLHKEHHEFIVSSVYASYWGTRNEGFLQTLPSWLAPLIFKFRNVSEILVWFMSVEYINLHQHEGYSFPWDPLEYWPFAGANFHDFHHSRSSGLRSGNYSLTFLQIWDQIFGGTSYRYSEWLQRKKEGGSGEDVVEKERMVLGEGEVVVEAEME